MKQGLYKHTKDDECFDREKIIIEVSETAKSYIFELIINTFRYSPVHIDMMFAKSDKVIIKKREKSSHDYFRKRLFCYLPLSCRNTFSV